MMVMPVVTTQCVDCGLGCIVAGEWYMANDDVWKQAWLGRGKSWHGRVPGQEILCIGCLENRIGRTLCASDFIPDVSVNDPNSDGYISERMRDRLAATESSMSGEGCFDWLAWRLVENLPEDQRQARWLTWKQRTPPR